MPNVQRSPQQTQPRLDHNKRVEVEMFIYKVYDTVDKTGTNSDYYRSIFANMTDEQFFAFCGRRLPFRYHEDEFKNPPKMYSIIEAFKVLDKPLFERVNMPYVYEDENGVAVQTEEALVFNLHLKRMKQMLSKKNNASMHVEKRDPRTGMLGQEDKAAKETDREFESLGSYGLDYTMDEFRTVKADATQASKEMIATIVDKGSVSQKDYVVTRQDSIARNLLNVYLLGAGVHSSLVDTGYMTPYTARKRNKMVERQ